LVRTFYQGVATVYVDMVLDLATPYLRFAAIVGFRTLYNELIHDVDKNLASGRAWTELGWCPAGRTITSRTEWCVGCVGVPALADAISTENVIAFVQNYRIEEWTAADGAHKVAVVSRNIVE
jgi:hypothetical protein